MLFLPAILTFMALVAAPSHAIPVSTSTAPGEPNGTESTTVTVPPIEPSPGKDGFETIIPLSNGIKVHITAPLFGDDILNYIVDYIGKTERRFAQLEKLRSELRKQVYDLQFRIFFRSGYLGQFANVDMSEAERKTPGRTATPKPLETDAFEDLLEDYNYKQEELADRIRQFELGTFYEFTKFRDQLEKLGCTVESQGLEELGWGKLDLESDLGGEPVAPKLPAAREKAITAFAGKFRDNIAKVKKHISSIFSWMDRGTSESTLSAKLTKTILRHPHTRSFLESRLTSTRAGRIFVIPRARNILIHNGSRWRLTRRSNST